jgi:hypothetical protein
MYAYRSFAVSTDFKEPAKGNAGGRNNQRGTVSFMGGQGNKKGKGGRGNRPKAVHYF